MDFAEELWSRLIIETEIDTNEKQKKPSTFTQNWETIDLNSIAHPCAREIGAEWLCYQALDQLNMSAFLRSQGWTDNDIRLTLTRIISRAVYPASELKTARWIRENSAVCSLTGFPVGEISKDRLYRHFKKNDMKMIYSVLQRRSKRKAV